MDVMLAKVIGWERSPFHPKIIISTIGANEGPRTHFRLVGVVLDPDTFGYVTRGAQMSLGSPAQSALASVLTNLPVPLISPLISPMSVKDL
jgi:hypothetical protein